jgi:hypothetical protein
MPAANDDHIIRHGRLHTRRAPDPQGSSALAQAFAPPDAAGNAAAKGAAKITLLFIMQRNTHIPFGRQLPFAYA